VTEKVKMESKKFLILNDNENTKHQNWMETAKGVLG
jgi:hypothetical protein